LKFSLATKLFTPFESDSSVVPKICLSYRREDTPYEAKAIRDRLVAYFGRGDVVFDVDAIGPGRELSVEIDGKVRKCDCLLVLIGARWLTSTSQDGNRRIGNPNDHVRLEIEAALRCNIPVISLPLQNARMPKREQLPEGLTDLAERIALSIRPYWGFLTNLDTLITGHPRSADLSGRTRPHR
jgi:hypothetical protein